MKGKLTNFDAACLLVAFVVFIWSCFTIPEIGLKGLFSFFGFVASGGYILWTLLDKYQILGNKK